MPRYSSGAKKTISAIEREAKRRYASGGYTRAEKAKIKSAYQTGRVEANFENPSGGDADSGGWRQERRSLYKNPTNRRASARRYFDEADRIYRPGMKSYELAANVQRPAAQFRGRYAQHKGESAALLRRFTGAGGSSGSRGGAEVDIAAPGRSDALRTLLIQSAQGDPAAELTGTNIATALLTQNAPQETAAPRRERSAARPSGRENPWKIPSKYGLKVTSGKRPGAITTSGNVSDHAGVGPGTMARDFGGSPQQMDKAAREIAASLGVKNWKGGVLNVKKGGWRYQVLYRTNVGGNHYNHIHVGRKRV